MSNAISELPKRGGGADEAPQCYKRLADVLAYHGETIDVLHTLRPVGVAMAGHDTFDPYKLNSQRPTPNSQDRLKPAPT